MFVKWLTNCFLLQTDWYGQNILTYTHPDDHKFLREQLAPTNLETLLDIQTGMDSSGEQRPRTREEEEMIDRKLREDRRDITIRWGSQFKVFCGLWYLTIIHLRRMARAGPRSEPTVYEIVRFTGSFRRADLAPRGTKVTYPGLHMIRRARAREESFLPLHSVSGNDIVLVCVGLIVRPPKICDRLLEACKTEYKTRHLIDGRIVQCEQAISIVAGYMTDEVTGLSPFAFMHKDEVRWVMVALRQSKYFAVQVNDERGGELKDGPHFSVRLQQTVRRVLLPPDVAHGQVHLPEDSRVPGDRQGDQQGAFVCVHQHVGVGGGRQEDGVGNETEILNYHRSERHSPE